MNIFFLICSTEAKAQSYLLQEVNKKEGMHIRRYTKKYMMKAKGLKHKLFTYDVTEISDVHQSGFNIMVFIQC